jgi:hypothetical protein
LDNPWTKSVVEELETLMAEGQRDVILKELRFSSSMGSMRLTAKEESADFSAPTSSYLRRKPRQGKFRRPNTDPES